MGKRGKVSNESRLVALPTDRGSRPGPPAELTAAEAAFWHKVVHAMPAAHFRTEDLDQLALLCTTRIELDEIKSQMQRHRDGDLLGHYDQKAYSALRKERREHLRTYMAQLRSLRLTRQSLDRRVETRKRFRDNLPTGAVMPWDDVPK